MTPVAVFLADFSPAWKLLLNLAGGALFVLAAAVVAFTPTRLWKATGESRILWTVLLAAAFFVAGVYAPVGPIAVLLFVWPKVRRARSDPANFATDPGDRHT